MLILIFVFILQKYPVWTTMIHVFKTLLPSTYSSIFGTSSIFVPTFVANKRSFAALPHIIFRILYTPVHILLNINAMCLLIRADFNMTNNMIFLSSHSRMGFSRAQKAAVHRCFPTEHFTEFLFAGPGCGYQYFGATSEVTRRPN